MSDRRLNKGIVRGGPLKAFKTAEQAYRAGQWFLAAHGDMRARAWCIDNDIGRFTKAQSEAPTNTAGGFLVPFEIENAIINLREIGGVFRSSASVVTVATDAGHMPRRTSGVTSNYTVEGNTITESTPGWDAVGYAMRKLAVLTRTSSEIDEDSVVSLGDFITNEIAYAFARAEDTAGLNGDATSTYFGMSGVAYLLNNVATAGLYTASGHSTFATVTLDDLATLLALLPSEAVQGARWFCHPSFFALVLCRLATNSGGIGARNVNGQILPSFWNLPVVVTSLLPNSTTPTGKLVALLGDLSQAATLFERRGVTVARSDQRYFENDQIGWRGTERFHIVCHDVGDSSSAGPLVGLVMG